MSSRQKRPVGREWVSWPIKPLWPCGLQRQVTDSTMAGSEAVQRATELIEQRLAQEEENEVWGPKGVLRRPNSAVKGRKSLAATPVVGKRTGVTMGPSGSMPAPAYPWKRGYWQWETEASAPRTETVLWASQAVLPETAHLPGLPGSTEQDSWGTGGDVEVGSPEMPQLLSERLGQEELQGLALKKNDDW